MSLRCAVPILPSQSAAKSVAFWCDVLGFEKLWEHQFEEGFPLYVGVRLGAVELHLNEHAAGAEPISLFLTADDLAAVDACYAAWVDKGLEADPPEDQPWGVRSFTFTDPDGHEITVGHALPSFDDTRT